jgi:hypothetical protein
MIQIHRIVCYLAILTLICFSSIPAVVASEYTVSPAGAEFTSIQAAINRSLL